MLARMRWTATLLVSPVVFSAAMLVSSPTTAQQVRYYTENGLQYKEVRRTIQRPVYERRTETREQTVYREKYSTQYEPQLRTVLTPVTTYRWQGRWHDVLNPFRPAYVGYHLVPRTHWQAETHNVSTPVTRRELKPEKQVVTVPVTTKRYVNEEVIHRTVMGPAAGVRSGVPSVASRTAIGGISRVENDPPRQGSEWRASTARRTPNFQ